MPDGQRLDVEGTATDQRRHAVQDTGFVVHVHCKRLHINTCQSRRPRRVTKTTKDLWFFVSAVSAFSALIVVFNPPLFRQSETASESCRAGRGRLAPSGTPNLPAPRGSRSAPHAGGGRPLPSFRPRRVSSPSHPRGRTLQRVS